MKKGPIITAVVTAFALTAVVAAFVSNASPYVTIAQAKTIHSDQLHLAGDLLKGSVSTDYATHTLTFKLRDKDGQVITVLHKGEPPESMSTVTKVVAIGGMQGDRFVSNKLLLKCPSKYEGASLSQAGTS